MKANFAFTFRRLTGIRRTILRTCGLILACAPGLALAQFSEIKMGEYLHYAVAAANGGIYAGIDGIGYNGVFGSPSLYTTNTGWVDLPSTLGFTNASPYGQPKGISHDGSVIAGYMVGVVSNGISIQVAAYWVNGVESLVPAPPDDASPTIMTAAGVSGDGTTLIVQDQTSSKTESYVFKIAGGTFTSLGFLGGGTNQHTYATAINNDGTIVAGYYDLDNGDIHGFIWTATNGVTDMGIPVVSHPNTHYLEPTCISDDGTTVFGQLTEFNGWVGFRYNTTSGFQDLPLTPSACTADGTEAAGIEFMYFPAAWSISNGGGYLDHLLTANGTTQALGTIVGPVTISPDGSAITALGPDAYLTDQIWYGTWQIFLPVPFKAAPIPTGTQTFTTDYQTTLTEPAGTLTQYADFNNGASAILVKGPHYASAFVLNADGSFSYTPKPGYISNGTDPETGTPEDSFTYQLVSPNGTSSNALVRLNVLAPMAPTVANPTYVNVTATSATLGGAVTDNGGATITAVGVIYAASAIDSAPQLADVGVSIVTGTGTNGVFTVDISSLTPGTDYSFVAYATNSVGIGYSTVASFTSLATPQSWQETWFGGPTNSTAAFSADPYHTGVPNFAVYAFLGPYQDPSTASVSWLPQMQLSGGNFFYSFAEPFGVSGITYGAQYSATLQPNDWHPVADTGDPTTTPLSHVFSVPVAANTQLFMRLTVTFQ